MKSLFEQPKPVIKGLPVIGPLLTTLWHVIRINRFVAFLASQQQQLTSQQQQLTSQQQQLEALARQQQNLAEQSGSHQQKLLDLTKKVACSLGDLRSLQKSLAAVRQEIQKTHQASRTRYNRATEPVPRPVRLGWISSWHTRCGIASYSALLLQQLDTSWFTPVVLANHAEPVTPDGPAVFRCWHNFREEHLDSLLDRIVLEQLELLVIQFNFAFFNLQALADLLEQLFERNIGVVIFLHAVADAFMDGKTASLASIAPTLARADQIMVHTPADIKALYDAGLSDNVTLFPHGVQLLTDQKREQTRQNYGLSNLRVIGSYGFILPHKGILELIEAFALLQSQQQDLHLLLVNALYPHPGSEETLQRCQDAIRQLGLDNCITLISDYLEDQESLSLLAACDLIVFPYQYTQESSSAAVRLAVASWQPIACTPLAIFSDVQPLVHQLPGMTPELLAQGIAELLAGDMMPDEMLANRTRWIEEHAWVRSGRQLSRILRTIWVEHCTKVNDTLSPLDHTQ